MIPLWLLPLLLGAGGAGIGALSEDKNDIWRNALIGGGLGLGAGLAIPGLAGAGAAATTPGYAAGATLGGAGAAATTPGYAAGATLGGAGATGAGATAPTLSGLTALQASPELMGLYGGAGLPAGVAAKTGAGMSMENLLATAMLGKMGVGMMQPPEPQAMSTPQRQPFTPIPPMVGQGNNAQGIQQLLEKLRYLNLTGGYRG